MAFSHPSLRCFAKSPRMCRGIQLRRRRRRERVILRASRYVFTNCSGLKCGWSQRKISVTGNLQCLSREHRTYDGLFPIAETFHGRKKFDTNIASKETYVIPQGKPNRSKESFRSSSG